MSNTTKKTPFSIYSSSVNTGYGSEISSSFMPGVDITNLHSDEYGDSRDAPAQGPFTEKYVGGNQHRHVALNDGGDTPETRPELFHLSMSLGALEISGIDTLDVNRPRAYYLRDELAKRPLNIRNIQQTTGSTIIGNYTHDYEFVQTSGRFVNNRAFIESQGEGFAQYVTTQFITGAKDPNRTLPDFDLTGSNKFVFVNRFNAPGGTDVSSRGVLDTYSEEYAPNNVMTVRNHSVRSLLRNDLARHTPKATDITCSVTPTLYHADNRNTKYYKQPTPSDAVQVLVSGQAGTPSQQYIALDVAGGLMYWTDAGNDDIYRAPISGGPVETLISAGLNNPYGIGIDVCGGKMYWASNGAGEIRRSPIDGGAIEVLVTGLSAPRGLALDIKNQMVYWADDGGANVIQRAPMDGGTAETLVTGLSDPQGVALDLENEMVYWADQTTDVIQRARMDGGAVETVVSSPGDQPKGIALDTTLGFVYWADDASGGFIKKSSIKDGTTETLITGLNQPSGIALDIDGGGMYWTDFGDDVIRFAAMSNRRLFDNAYVTHEIPQADLRYAWIHASAITTEDQLPGHQNSSSIAYQPFDDIQYVSSSDFVSFNIDGSAGEAFRGRRFGKSKSDVYTGGSTDTSGGVQIYADTGDPGYDIAVDPYNEKIYFISGSAASYSPFSAIHRMNLDGTGDEVLWGGYGSLAFAIAGSSSVRYIRSLSVDTENNMLYWGGLGGPGLTTGSIFKQRTDGVPLTTEKMFFTTVVSNQLISASVDINGNFSDSGSIYVASGDMLGLGVDNINNKLYWTERDIDEIHSSSFDGSNEGKVCDTFGPGDSRGLDVSANDDLIVWVERDTANQIRTASLDGADPGPIATGLDRPYGVAIDARHKKIYFSQLRGIVTTPDFIGSCSYDGSNLGFLPGINSALDPGDPNYTVSLTIDRKNNKLYAITGEPDPATETKIYKCDLDGTNPELVLTYEQEDGPGDIQVDPYADRLYFSGFTDSTGLFSCSLSNPGTSSTENLFGQPIGTGSAAEGIYRLQLYGPQTETVYSFPQLGDTPFGISVDSCEERIYYSIACGGCLEAGSLGYVSYDGVTNNQFFTQSVAPATLVGVDYDSEEKILYWVDIGDPAGAGTAGIWKTSRVDLPEITFSQVLPGTSFPTPPSLYRISVDSYNEKIYVNDYASGSVWRLNKDGSSLEQVLTQALNSSTDKGIFTFRYNASDDGLYWGGRVPNSGSIKRWRGFASPGIHEDCVWTDFAGTNFHIYEPVDLSTNVVGHSNSTFVSGVTSSCTTNQTDPSAYNREGIVQYLNAHGPGHPIGYRINPDNVGSDVGRTAIFNSLMLHRNGPYQHPSWKSIRTGEHKVARQMKKENVISVEDPAEAFTVVEGNTRLTINPKGSNTSTNFTEPLVSSKYKPVKHLFTLKGAKSNTSAYQVKSTYANNISYFANKALNAKLTLFKCGDQAYNRFLDMYDSVNSTLAEEENPVKDFISFKYNETVYPKEENTYLNITRTRDQYAEVAGYGVNGYDKQYGTQRTFWRDNVADRQRSYTEALADGIITVPGYFNSFNNHLLEPWYGEFSFKAGSLDAHLGGRSVWPIDRASDLEFESLSLIGALGGAITPEPISRWPYRTLASQNTGELNKGNFSFSLAWFGDNASAFLSTIVENNGFFALFQQERISNLESGVANRYQNVPLDYCYFLGGYQSGSGVSGSSAPYNSTLDHGLNYKIQEESGKKPWYDSYDEYSSDIRYAAKDYSVIPEFKISDQMEYYVGENTAKFKINNNKIFDLKGATLSSSAVSETSSFDESFFKTYLHSDISKDYDKVSSDHKTLASLDRITLKCKGIKKLLPYTGFYPQNRTLQMASLLSQSLFPYTNGEKISLTTDAITSANQRQIDSCVAQPFFGPGILYNTIKSGIAVDWPTYTGSILAAPGNFDPDILTNVINRVSASSDPQETYGKEVLWTYQAYGSASNYRLPFETLASLRLGLPQSSSDGEGKVWYTSHEVDLDSEPTLINEWAANRLPFFQWDHKQSLPLFEMAMNNFLAETVNFFIKERQLLSLNSKTQSEWQVLQKDKPYYMDIALNKVDLDMIQAYSSSNHPLDTDVYSEGRKMNGRYFGPPSMRKETSTYTPLSPGFLDEYAWNDPAYAPYTPPYFEGKATARIKFIPLETKQHTIEEIFSGSTVTYINAGFDGDYSGSIAHIGTMKLDSSINIFGRRTILKTTYEAADDQSVTDTQGVQFASSDLAVSAAPAEEAGLIVKETGIDFSGDNDMWTISPKFECPVLDFQGDLEALTGRTTGSGGLTDTSLIQTSGFGRGMWGNYGTQPTGSQGIFLGVEDPIKKDDPSNGSLLSALGFSAEQKRIGEVADTKQISEAIVAIPFVDYPITQENTDFAFTREYICKNVIGIDREIFDIQKVNLEKGRPAIREGDFGSSVAIKSTSVTDMITKMKKYILPPQLDFVKLSSAIDPFVMYIMEFEHTLDNEDLSDIWQGVMPKIAISAEKDEAFVSHTTGKFEFFGGKGLPAELRWMVFKVKRKAADNYFNLLPELKDKTIKQNFNFDYTYNWPYDHFSLVELAKIEVETEFNNHLGIESTQQALATGTGATANPSNITHTPTSKKTKRSASSRGREVKKKR